MKDRKRGRRAASWLLTVCMILTLVTPSWAAELTELPDGNLTAEEAAAENEAVKLPDTAEEPEQKESAEEPELPDVELLADEAWSETADTAWYDSAGTGATQYEIGTAEELAGLGKLVNAGTVFKGKTIYLTKDLSLSGKAWIPIGEGWVDTTGGGATKNITKAFQGAFDGQGHTISHLNTGDRRLSCVGLFGAISRDATIRNLKLTVDYVSSVAPATWGNGVGGLVGAVLEAGEGGGIANIYVTVDGTVDASGTGTIKAFRCAGGLAGIIWSKETLFDVSNCFVDVNEGAVVTAGPAGGTKSDFVGGYVGFSETTIKASRVKVAGRLQGELTGGFVGSNHKNGLLNCYSILTSTAVINGTNSASALVGASNTNPAALQNCYVVDDAVYEGAGDKGVVVGTANTAVTASNIYYWSKEEYGAVGSSKTAPTLTNVEAKTKGKLKEESTFVGFDFAETWVMDEDGSGYPIIKTEESGAGAVQAAYDWLSFNIIKGANAGADSITSDLLLPTSYAPSGALISWRSSDPETISNTGKLLDTSETKTITLEATITKNLDSLNKSFQVGIVGTHWTSEANTAWYDRAPQAAQYEIDTVEELAGLAKLVNAGNVFKGKTIRLTSDIDLSGLKWMPIGRGWIESSSVKGATANISKAFQGTFDGQNYTISHLDTGDLNLTCVGLFGGVSRDAVIKNLKLTVDYASSTAPGSWGNGVGGLIGSVLEAGEGGGIANIYVTVNGSIRAAGSGAVSAFRCAGGLAGIIWAKETLFDVANCFVDVNEGAVISAGKASGKSLDYVGGYVGFSETTIKSSRAKVAGQIEGDRVGGFIGSNHKNGLQNCYAILTDKAVITAANAGSPLMGGTFTKAAMLENCYVVDEATYQGAGKLGAVLGDVQVATTASNIYYYSAKGMNSVGNSPKVTPTLTNVGAKTKEELKKQSTFTGFDFNETWIMDTKGDGYPIIGIEQSAEADIQAAFDWLTFDVIKGGNTTAASITSDLVLPGSHATSGAIITWNSSEPSVISNDGKLLETSKTAAVILEATISKNLDNKKKVFLLGVTGTRWIGAADTAWYDKAPEATQYEIGTAEELAGLAELVNAGNVFKGKTIRLTSDIDLSGLKWTPIGLGWTGTSVTSKDISKAFQGTFDGQNYTISHLDTGDLNLSCVGLFGGVSRDAVIKNLKLTVDYVSSSAPGSWGKGVGGLIGSVLEAGEGGGIANIYVTVNGSIQTNGSGAVSVFRCVGGLAGIIWSKETLFDVANCFVDINKDAVITAGTTGGKATDYVGGYVGFSETTIKSSRAKVAGQIEGEQVGGFIGANHKNGLQNCYAILTNTAVIQAANAASPLVGVTQNKAALLENCYVVDEATYQGAGKLGAVLGDVQVATTATNIYYYSAKGTGSVGDSPKVAPTLTNVEAKTKLELKNQNTFQGFDFAGTWMMDTEGDGYPIIGIEQSGASAVQAAYDWLTFDVIKGENATAASITSDLTLPDSYGSDGVTISWKSSEPEIISTTGKLLDTPKTTTITLEATITKNLDSMRKTFQVGIIGTRWIGIADTAWYDKAPDATQYEIGTAEELAGLATLVNAGNVFKNKTVRLSGDIDLSGLKWTPIGLGWTVSSTVKGATANISKAFQGTFDGQNYTISHLDTGDLNLTCVGLFGGVSRDAVIKNLKLTVDYASSTAPGSWGNGVGGLIGSVLEAGEGGGIANIYVTVNGSILAAGSGAVSAFRCAGGLAGIIWAKETLFDVANCFVDVKEGAVISAGKASGKSQDFVGGYVGFSETTIKSSRAKVAGQIEGDRVGGFIGSNHKNGLQNCYAILTNTAVITAANAGSPLMGGTLTKTALLENCYVVDEATYQGAGKLGAVLGDVQIATTASNIYYYSARGMNSVGNSPKVTPTLTNVGAKTKEELKAQNTFQGFDFNKIWVMDTEGDGYPIIGTEQSGMSDIEEALQWLTFDVIKGENAAVGEITKPLSLPDVYPTNGAVIRWASDKPDVITDEGRVLNPPELTTVVLTAYVSKNLDMAQKTFTLQVPVRSYTDDEVKAFVDEWLTFDQIKGLNKSENRITKDLILPTEHTQLGIKVSWSSTDPSVVGTDGKVRTPSGDAKRVTLTAAYQMGEKQGTKTFELLVSDFMVGVWKYDDNLTWVTAGDSITESSTWFMSGYLGYQELLQRRINGEMGKHFQFVNTGYGGKRASDLNANSDAWINNYKPDVVSIHIGMNDQGNAADANANLKALLEKLVPSAGNVKNGVSKDRIIVLLGTNPDLSNLNNTALENMCAYAKQLAGEYAAQGYTIKYIDIYNLFKNEIKYGTYPNLANSKAYGAWSPIHPNGAGQLEIAKKIIKELGIYSDGSAVCQMTAYDIGNYIPVPNVAVDYSKVTKQNGTGAISAKTAASGYNSFASANEIGVMLSLGGAVSAGAGMTMSQRTVTQVIQDYVTGQGDLWKALRRTVDLSSADMDVADMDSRIADYLDTYHPLYISIMPEPNELYEAGYSHSAAKVASFKTSLTSLVQKCQAAGVSVVLLTPPPTQDDQKNVYLKEYVDAIIQVAQTKNTEISNLYNFVSTLPNQQVVKRNWYENGYPNGAMHLELGKAFLKGSAARSESGANNISGGLTMTMSFMNKSANSGVQKDNFALRPFVRDGKVIIELSELLSDPVYSSLTSPATGNFAIESVSGGSTSSIPFTFDSSAKTLAYSASAGAGKQIRVKVVNGSLTSYLKTYTDEDIENGFSAGAIQGTARFGETLQAGAITPSTATVTYAWYHEGDSTLMGSRSTYTLTKDDIGKVMTLVITGTGDYPGKMTFQTETVKKKAGAANAGSLTAEKPTGIANNNGKITGLDTAKEYEYKLQTAASYAKVRGGSSEITGLTPGTYLVRIQESDTVEASGTTTVEVKSYVAVTIQGSIAVSGAAIYGQTLEAVVSGLQPENATINYQWYRGEAKIANATGAAYTLAAADVGQQMKVEAEGCGDYAGKLTSALTGKVDKQNGPEAPAGLTAAAPTGHGVKDGKITGLDTKRVYEYKKESEESYTAVAAAASQITGLEAGAYSVRIAETETQKASAATVVNVPGYESVAIEGTLSITGSAVVGSTLTAEILNLSPADATVSYQWYLGETKIEAATGAAYTLTTDDIGQPMKVEAEGCGDYTGKLTSAPTGIVDKQNGPEAPAGLTGTAPTGHEAKNGKITGLKAELVYEYKKESEESYTAVAAGSEEITGLEAGIYSVRISETETQKASAATLVSVPAYESIVIEGTAVITGSAVVGGTLTAEVTNLSPAAATVSYQWYRGETEIAEATSKDYVVTEADAGMTLSVIVKGTGDYTGILTAEGVAIPVLGYSVTGYIQAPAGKTILVTLRQGENKLATAAAIEGLFTLESVKDGTYALEIAAPGALTRTVEITVEGTKYEVSTEDNPIDLMYGDADGNGIIGGSDLAEIKKGFSSSRGDAAYGEALDCDGNGTVGGPDISEVKKNFNKSSKDYTVWKRL